MFKKIIIALIMLGVALWLAVQIPAVQDAAMAKIMHTRMAGSQEPLFEENSLNAMVCGSTSPFPSPNRAGPCIAIFAGDKFYIVDTGSRSWNNLALRGIPAEKLGGIFITHFHSDHIAELGEYNMQSWAAGRDAPLDVYGGTGIDQIVAGFELAYAADRSYREAHHGAKYMNPNIARMHPHTVNVHGDSVVVMKTGRLTVTAFNVDHQPISPAIGYRFDFGGRSIVISGDTVKSTSLIKASQDADLLFHEAQAQHMVVELEATAKDVGNTQLAKLFFDIRNYHTSAIEAAEVANEANVAELALYHLTPPPPNNIAAKIFLRGVSDIRKSGVTLADDGLFYRLPLDSNEQHLSHIKPL